MTPTIDDFDNKYTEDTSVPSESHMTDGQFETFGADLAHVQAVASVTPNRVWTFVDGDEGYCLVNGMAFVNRVAYLITVESGQDDEWYLVDDYSGFDN